MDTKALAGVRIKDETQGLVEAVFATFNEVDADDDVTLPGAFEAGAPVPISSYGHTSWQGALPVGKGVIRTTAKEAILEGQFFMDTTHGRDAFLTVKQLGPLGQWSYGYDPLEFHFGEFGGRKVRFLSKQQVHEVSPVLRGAGVGTRTLSAKSDRPTDARGAAMGVIVKTAIRPHDSDVVNRAWDRAAVVAGVPDDATVTDLRSMAAWVDPSEDPETKGAYSFWHHHGPGGAANVRACVSGIGILNGGRGVDVSATSWAGDRQAIWEHLAGHIRDADREPPELRADGGTIKDVPGDGRFRDELAATLAGVEAAIVSTDRVVALRAQKGKQLSRINAEYLDWLDEDLMALHRKLRSYIDTPDDDAVREYLRYVQQTIGGHTP